MICPDGLVSARSLRAEVAAGRLRPTRIAGRIFVTRDDLTAFLQTARQTDNHARKNTGLDWLPCHSSVTKLIPESHPARYRSVAVSPATVRRELSTLAAALAYCQREGHLLEAPTVWRPPASAPREAYLSRQEVARLIRAARKDARSGRHLALFILLAYYTGRRKEAILTLQWAPNSDGGHVDLEKGVIDFRPTGRVETAKRRGRLEIPDRLLRFLRHARRRTRTHLSEYGPHNRPIRDVKRSFASAARAAGLAPEIVTPHTLRHTCISHLAQAGVPLFDACQWVDVTMETAERVYAHSDGRHDRVRNALGQGGRMRRAHPLPPSL